MHSDRCRRSLSIPAMKTARRAALSEDERLDALGRLLAESKSITPESVQSETTTFAGWRSPCSHTGGPSHSGAATASSQTSQRARTSAAKPPGQWHARTSRSRPSRIRDPRSPALPGGPCGHTRPARFAGVLKARGPGASTAPGPPDASPGRRGLCPLAVPAPSPLSMTTTTPPTPWAGPPTWSAPPPPCCAPSANTA
jgi:hypothetical protein